VLCFGGVEPFCLLFNIHAERALSEGLSFSFKKQPDSAAAAAATAGVEPCDKDPRASAAGPFAEASAHAANGAGADRAVDGSYVLADTASLATTIADFSGSDWHM
jgi:hypothetical protein